MRGGPTVQNQPHRIIVIKLGATFVRPRCTSKLFRRARTHATCGGREEGGRPLSEPAPATPTNLTRFVRGTTLWRHIWRGFVVIAIIAKSASRHAPTKQLRLLGNEIRPTTRPAKTPLDEAGPNGASSEERACFGVGLIGHHLRARSK